MALGITKMIRIKLIALVLICLSGGSAWFGLSRASSFWLWLGVAGALIAVMLFIFASFRGPRSELSHDRGDPHLHPMGGQSGDIGD